MIQEKINRAYESLMKLNNFKLPVKKAYAVYKLVQAADSAYQFALSEERKYLDEFHGTLKEDGNITFLTPSDCTAFKTKLDELCNMEVDIAIEVVKTWVSKRFRLRIFSTWRALLTLHNRKEVDYGVLGNRVHF